MQIQHIFFDLDHTLWDFEKNSAKAFDHIFSQNKIEVDINKFLEVYTPLNANYWKLYREEKITKSALRFARLKDTFDALNFDTNEELIWHLSDEYISALPNFNHLFEGAIEVLEYLMPKYPMHIITNGFEEVQTQKLIKANIRNYFDKIVTSESVGVKKPNPIIFNHAMELTSSEPHNTIMIGDNYEADILGAHQVGMNTMFFNYHNEKIDGMENNIIHITSLSEIKNYL
jgi:putative hydrolase of the HAD superfamily